MKIQVIEQNSQHLGPLARMPRALIEALTGTKHDTLKPLPKGEYECDEDIGEIVNFAVALRALWVDRLVQKSAAASVKSVEAAMKNHNGITGGFEQIAERINELAAQGVTHTRHHKETEERLKKHFQSIESNRNERQGQRHWAQEKFDVWTELLALLRRDHDALCLVVEEHPITGHRVEIEALKDRITALEIDGASDEGLPEESLFEAQMQSRVMALEDTFKPLERRVTEIEKEDEPHPSLAAEIQSLNKAIPTLTSRITTLEGARAANDATFDEQELRSRVEELAARLGALETTDMQRKAEIPEGIQSLVVDAVRRYMENNLAATIETALRDSLTLTLGKVDNVLDTKAKELHNFLAKRLDEIEADQIKRVEEYLATYIKLPENEAIEHDERARKES